MSDAQLTIPEIVGGSLVNLTIAGLARLSVCDWPGQLVATVFLQGCPWRCRYCHNPALMAFGAAGVVQWHEVWAHLLSRRGLLDAVVFSGGEPTAQDGLAAAADRVRELGYQVGLHTGGAYPKRLASLLPRLDWVGLDIKGLPAEYPAITGVVTAGDWAWASLRSVLAAGVACEVRTTVDPRFHTAAGLAGLIDILQAEGVSQLVLQEVRLPSGTSAGPSAAQLLDELGTLPAGVSRRAG